MENVQQKVNIGQEEEQSKGPPVDEKLNKMQCVPMIPFGLTKKENPFRHETTWVNSEDTVSEITIKKTR